MIIDNGPAIKAFVQERIRHYETFLAAEQMGFTNPAKVSRIEGLIDELQMVVTLADGLEKQNALISNAMARKEVS